MSWPTGLEMPGNVQGHHILDRSLAPRALLYEIYINGWNLPPDVSLPINNARLIRV